MLKRSQEIEREGFNRKCDDDSEIYLHDGTRERESLREDCREPGVEWKTSLRMFSPRHRCRWWQCPVTLSSLARFCHGNDSVSTERESRMLWTPTRRIRDSSQWVWSFESSWSTVAIFPRCVTVNKEWKKKKEKKSGTYRRSSEESWINKKLSIDYAISARQEAYHNLASDKYIKYRCWCARVLRHRGES